MLPPYDCGAGVTRGGGAARDGRGAASKRGWRRSRRCRSGRRGRHPDRDYRERLDYELDVICKMGFAGYFLIVADFIRLGQGARHPGRARPRLGRRLGGRLGARHHRSRSAALRPAVRALPQSRARVDAGLRHRLLPGPARRGDPPRPARSTAHDRVAQIITFGKLQARAVLRDVGRVLGLPYGQVDSICKLVPNNPGQPGDASHGALKASRSCRRWSPRTRRCAAGRHRPAAGGPLPPRLDARRRRRDRRPAADRADPALPRPALRRCWSPAST